jgi:glycosidase
MDGLRGTLTHWQEELAEEGWNSLHLNNHDEPRVVSRFGDDGEYRRESAKLLGTLLFTLQGTPYVYQGEELGMTNYPFESLDEVRDVDTLKNVETALRSGRFASESEVLDLVRHRSRDNARTPMQWSADDNAGFTDGDPWMPVNPNYETVNVESERANPDSVFHYYRRLVELREDHDVVVYGEYDLRSYDHEQVWAYTRTLGDETVFVVLNFSDDQTGYEPESDLVGRDAEVLVSNYEAGDRELGDLSLLPWEARVYRLL